MINSLLAICSVQVHWIASLAWGSQRWVSQHAEPLELWVKGFAQGPMDILLFCQCWGLNFLSMCIET